MIVIKGGYIMKNLMDTPQLAEYLSINKHTVYVWRNQGMPNIKVGSQYRYNIEDVLKWLESRSVKNK